MFKEWETMFLVDNFKARKKTKQYLPYTCVLVMFWCTEQVLIKAQNSKKKKGGLLAKIADAPRPAYWNVISDFHVYFLVSTPVFEYSEFLILRK